ncbi:glycosyltransferase, group 1 [Oleiphilus messinensis]|uniref:Glycosyltransferase, group 1 n=1 Tax=Oleiphilus messinensis TaxID=141451 RepID=A0A1Y0I3F5_9GAMM|nr:glycosyltransferase family 4 protein [Oleiphilus messinensis]ARU55002.1 glycosyltransferase, group 1 [Oleiphilus messinensis]
MKIALLNTQVPFVVGGAEMHADNLKHALIEHGHQAELVSIPFKWYPPERILQNMMACRMLDITESCGDKIDLAIGLRFPAYLIPHPNKVLWILHQYRTAYDLWESPLCDLKHYPNGGEVRAAIETADRALLPEAKAIFSNSQNVSNRLKKYCDIDSTPLYHPPPNAEQFYCEGAEPYFFYPSRITSTKRQSLVIEALALTQQPVVMYFAGSAEEPDYENKLKQKAAELGVSDRIKWLGRVTDQEKRQFYARSLAVVFPPVDEDYGYITLEAMLSRKAVITLSDSGGPLEFVLPDETGFICEPSAESLANQLDHCWSIQAQLKQIGENGYAHYQAKNINWHTVVESLISSPVTASVDGDLAQDKGHQK